jgi:hypothetical protein
MQEGIVTFQITGCVGRWRGVVVEQSGYHGRPEIRVTEVLRDGEWTPDINGWPVLKDGDYILMGEPHA